MDDTAWTAPPGAAQPAGIQSTAGAVPVFNEKGEMSMKKVKVQRYVSGKRPDYAPASSDDEETDDEDFTHPRTLHQSPQNKILTDAERQDPRLRRIYAARHADDDTIHDNEIERERVVHEAEVIEMSDAEMSENEGGFGSETEHAVPERDDFNRHRLAESDEESEGEMDEEELAQKRLKMRERALQKTQQEQEVLGKEDEGSSESSEEESSEYTDESESDEEGPRLKPVFVHRKDRLTNHQKDIENSKHKQQEIEAKRRGEERRRDTLRMIEQDHRTQNNTPNINDLNLDAINTDDDADDQEYDQWKLRELKRLKRDKDEREAAEKEKEDLDRLRNMTEDERKMELRNNPKQVTNKAVKGKYKFLQKYYHRGVFFLDNEENVYKRDFSGATLEDHFDKTVLPKVMQVKNFGRSGRTKYTHLVEQDTTSFDSPWASDTQMNHKFFNSNAGGLKQVFEKPTKSDKSTARK